MKISFFKYYKEQVKDCFGYCLKKTFKHFTITRLFAFIDCVLLLFLPVAVYIMYLYDTNQIEKDKRYK